MAGRHRAPGFLLALIAGLLAAGSAVAQVQDTRTPAFRNGPRIMQVAADRMVVLWETDEPTTSTLRYGVSGQGQATVIPIAGTRTFHSAVIGGLLANTPYDIRIDIQDAAGNGRQSPVLQRTTRDPGDIPPPSRIWYGPQALVSAADHVVIDWGSSFPATSILRYRPRGATAWTFASDSLHRVEGSLRLNGLQPGTSYEFEVTITDLLGRQDTRSGTFRTTSHSDAVPPRIVSGPYLINQSEEGVWVEWSTDEPTRATLRLTNETTGVVTPISVDAYRQDHGLLLRQLQPNTAFSFVIEARDAADNLAVISQHPGDPGAFFSFGSSSLPDRTPPAFLDQPGVSANNVVGSYVDWQATEPVRVTFEVAPDSGSRGENDTMDYWPFARVIPGFVPLEFVTASGVAPNGRFRLSAQFADAFGNVTTKSLGAQDVGAVDVTPPVLLSDPPRILEQGVSNARILLEFNEPVSVTLYACPDGQACGDPRIVGAVQPKRIHRLSLQGLTPDVSYKIWVEAQDLVGNQSTFDKNYRVGTTNGLDFTIPEGWSLFGVGLNPSSLRASDVISAAQNAQIDVQALYAWTGSRWTSYRPGLPVGNFLIEPGRAYFVQSRSGGTMELPGTPLSDRFTVSLTTGWNTVGHWDTDQVSRASELATHLQSSTGQPVQSIATWDGGWRIFRPALGVNDFFLEPGKGYLVGIY